MRRRERLLATLRGQPVDRPAVSFYEVGGWRMDPDGDELTVWNDPSWRPLVEMALARTDIMRMAAPAWRAEPGDPLPSLTETHTWREGASQFTRTVVHAPGRDLQTLVRRDADTQTVWTLEHPLKDAGDAEAFLRLPPLEPRLPDTAGLEAEEASLGEDGILLIDAGDPLCCAAELFSMEDYTIAAMTEPELFRRLLERFARQILPECERLAAALPGRLWRICGSEYAGEPYLPPRLYAEYMVPYTGQMVASVQRHGGFARVHSHGRLRGILTHLAAMGVDALDPLEPPPQGDMELREIRERIGDRVVLMGNIEASDIECLPARQFERKVETALREGTAGPGRGFVLHPSSCPYGRTITPLVMENYRTMLRLTEDWGG
jgi:uroporphyrinogen-III decarboxylase